jgi:methionyl-tRNA formyltransferase
MAGDAETGICIMQMEAGLDTGPVLMRAATPIGPEETTGELHDRLSAMGARLIVEALARLEELRPEPQPEEGVTYAAKIDKAEARVDWARPAAEVARHVNGLSPFPGAWCEVGGERLKLLRARIAEGDGAPGEVLGGLRIACGEGAVEVLKAQREGKRPMTADEILRGLTLPARLG